MRTRIIATRLTCRLCVLGLIAVLIGSSFAQAQPQKSDEQLVDNVEPEKKAPGSQYQKREEEQEATTSGMPTPQDMRDDMRRLMGPYAKQLHRDHGQT